MTSNCPICDKPLKEGESLKDMRSVNPYLPFCSDRCKLMDLGAWLDAKYSIPAEDTIDQ